MKKVVRLTESDLVRLVKRVINEQGQESNDDEVLKNIKFIKSELPNMGQKKEFYKKHLKSKSLEEPYYIFTREGDKSIILQGIQDGIKKYFVSSCLDQSKLGEIYTLEEIIKIFK